MTMTELERECWQAMTALRTLKDGMLAQIHTQDDRGRATGDHLETILRASAALDHVARASAALARIAEKLDRARWTFGRA